jgi:hypothetical protein
MLDGLEPSISIEVADAWSYASVPIPLDDLEPSSVPVRIPLDDAPVAAVAPQRRRRMPAWRPPTRWAHPPQRRSPAPWVLIALLAFAAFAIDQSWIDLDRWRLLIDSWI